ncbi:hypothetical protein [Nitrosopumilus adriaticus]|uniref:Uncharacterized protein n=1 Tax=Nitrosopumilus adriaticus TaxID=1580092 RepID=A0A0D5C5C2_9ARCH|nr:hypothetical protein [Nitrosopumilus adriaticus]AJW71753.1 conserved membrane protein of unknown function [Nitrosopumilus adriaticus]
MDEVKRTHSWIFGAFVGGLFYAILTRTGIDISPSGIGLTILRAFEPYVIEQSRIVFNIGEIVLYAIPVISLLAIWYHHGRNGFIAYVIVMILSYAFFLYFWKV